MKIRIETTPDAFQLMEYIEAQISEESTADEVLAVFAGMLVTYGYNYQSIIDAAWQFAEDRTPNEKEEV